MRLPAAAVPGAPERRRAIELQTRAPEAGDEGEAAGEDEVDVDFHAVAEAAGSEVRFRAYHPRPLAVGERRRLLAVAGRIAPS